MPVLVAIVGNFLGQVAGAGEAVRVTRSMDAKLAGAVLHKVAPLFTAGFGQAEANRVEQDINSLRPDRRTVWDFNVQYQGKAQSLKIIAQLDELGQIDLDFAIAAEAAAAVRTAVDGYLNSHGH